ncbi:Proteins containing the FAD binding domain [Handroanthus impetiginosus]|uniref:cytokinin dehydrogenase n=1 Tax=Handroanthus impetiginosus TaxID=429701 RepID=A0A2G9GXN5_9LAMI|nr:Proteins containing the FAD binding domain [Handroanthus impetiginosus]
MANPCPISSQLIIFLMIISIYSTVCTSYALLSQWNTVLSPDILRTDPEAIRTASKDYGNLVHETPSAVLYPSSISDIINLIKISNNCSTPFRVAARGRGHSVRGQAMTRGGVVVDMASLSSRIKVSWDPLLGYYADVGGEQMWIDVLRATLEHGLAPISWTDYLYLSVGGTLSNAGISGQSFLHGPQISNVLQLDVITGKGDFLTCTEDMNSELFFAVLGGLGQFGIITRARIVLHKAPSRAKWVRLLYSDFSMFTRDQEHLISPSMINGPDYVEGSLITDHSPPNNWRSSFYSSSHQSKIHSLLQKNQGLLYSIELVKYYHDKNADSIVQEVEMLVKDLNFIPGFIFKKDVSLLDFLNRVGIIRSDNNKKCSSEELGQVDAHPWLNLFVPKSRIMDFNAGVFVNMILGQNRTSGPILFYPLNRQKWDGRMSAVIPDEDIFYTLGLLHSSRNTPTESDVLDKLNAEIIEFCEKSGIKIKQYLPHYDSKEDWMKHYGPKWDTFQERKTKFDPRMILSPGHGICTSVMDADA